LSGQLSAPQQTLRSKCKIALSLGDWKTTCGTRDRLPWSSFWCMSVMPRARIIQNHALWMDVIFTHVINTKRSNGRLYCDKSGLWISRRSHNVLRTISNQIIGKVVVTKSIHLEYHLIGMYTFYAGNIELVINVLDVRGNVIEVIRGLCGYCALEWHTLLF
jgi:hypothetical protein